MNAIGVRGTRAASALRRIAPATVLLGLLFAPTAWAWNDTGHMVTALVAYDALPAPQQAAAVALLRKHPRFVADFEPNLPQTLATASTPEQNRWYFAFAATWPDLARHFGHIQPPAARAPLIDRYSHSKWHYIDLPTYLQPSDAKILRVKVPSMTVSRRLPDADLNLVQALTRLTDEFCRPGASEEDRALALSWLLHLIGDMHEPLHTTSLYAAGAYPTGDRGGNDILVRRATNLHALWDGALGNDRRWGRISAMASKYGAAASAGAAGSFQDWAHEGRELASRVVYSPTIRGAVAAAPAAGVVRVSIDSSYRRVMRQTAESQISLAGARAAFVVAPLLDPDSARRCRR